MFEKVVIFSEHGTETGIWPRFYLQMNDLAQFAIGKHAFDTRSEKYFKTVIPQIIRFHEIYHEFKNLLDDYLDGILSGKYYKIDEKGFVTHNIIPERKINDKVKDFFIHGKIMLNAYVDSGIIDDNGFILRNFFYADETKIEKKKQEYLRDTDGLYIPLITVMEKAQKNFLISFNKVRGEIEHKSFHIDEFEIKSLKEGILVSEPIFQNQNLSINLQEYYEKILDLMEKLVAYFLGINAEKKRAGLRELYIRHEYDYTKMLYKYTIAIGGMIVLGTPADRCDYN